MSSLSLRTSQDDQRSIVSLSGELDLATVSVLLDEAVAQLDSAACQTLVLDLADLSFLDSTGLGCWIDLRNRAEDVGKTLLLESVPPAAKRTVMIAGLAPLFGLG